MSQHIEKMELELKELNEKIEKNLKFLDKEIQDPKITDEVQRIRLAIQMEYMLHYASVLNERIEYDKTKENDSYENKSITSEEYAKKYGFKNWEDFVNNEDYHVEKTEMNMKEWFFEDMSMRDIIDILEGKRSTDYGNWDYISDKDIWIYRY